MEDLKAVSPVSVEELAETLKKNRVNRYEDFEKGILHLVDYSGVKKFKSIRRAIRRGHVSVYGEVYPKRPFNNTNTKFNQERKAIYARLKGRNTIG